MCLLKAAGEWPALSGWKAWMRRREETGIQQRVLSMITEVARFSVLAIPRSPV